LFLLIFHQFFRFLYHSIFQSSLLFYSFFCQYVHLSFFLSFSFSVLLRKFSTTDTLKRHF
jgi:hypothetical protein